jgi:putative ABC transport system permease protein
VAFTIAVTAGAAVIFGLAPALKASGSNPSLSSTTRATISRGRRRFMSSLVTAEVALAMTLLVVGGLSVLDVYRLGRADPGFRSDGVLAFRVELPDARYPNTPSRGVFARDYAEKLASRPEVAAVAFASALPLSGHWGWFFEAEGYTRMEDEANPVVLNRIVTPGYFETMGVEMVRGRALDDFDGREPETMAAVVNETFVRTHLSHLPDPVGARIRTGPSSAWLNVVGVARDVKHYGVEEEMRPGVYQPWRQMPLRSFMVALVTDGEPGALARVAREVTAEIDPELPLYDVESMKGIVDQSMWTRRAASSLIALFSTVALLLAVAGIYGVVSYTVGQRTQEISIRMAMGAESAQVLGQIVSQGMKLVLAGAGIGLVVSLAAAGLVSGILVSVSARDPWVYVGVTLLLLAVAAAANYLPARRAATVEPMKILRGE